MSDLLRYFRNYKKEAVFAPLFKLIEACFELCVPLVIAKIVDTIIPSSNQGNLVAMVLLLAILAFVGILVSLTAQYYSAKAAVGVTQELTDALYAKVLTLPKSSQDQLTSSSLLTRLTSDTLQIQTGINVFLRLFLRAPIVVFGALIMAVTISPRLSLLFSGMIALLFLIVVIISRISSRLYQTLRKSLDHLVALVRENSMGMRVIRAFGQREREIGKFTASNNRYRKGQLHAGFWSVLLTPATYLVVNMTLVILIWQGKLAIADSWLEQGMLVALINYLLQILVELVKLVMVVNTLNQSSVSLERVQEIFNQESEDIHAPLQPVNAKNSQEILSVDQLTFSYPHAVEPALEGIDFSLQSGQFMGIIGGTGSGKSTLLSLLLHHYSPSKGKVQVFKGGSGPDSLADWRNQFALVPQKAQLFSGTVRSNLCLGLEAVADDSIWRALSIAQAAEFVREKGGLDADVAAFGRNFSGGQRQRLTIARAILQAAPILILDDATSALDYVTESRLLRAIDEQLPHQTLIMVSQRTNSLRAADKILVLDKGKQVGLGNHANLLNSSAIYREIDQSQHAKEVENHA